MDPVNNIEMGMAKGSMACVVNGTGMQDSFNGWKKKDVGFPITPPRDGYLLARVCPDFGEAPFKNQNKTEGTWRKTNIDNTK